MEKLEQYKDFLLPVNDIVYANYENPKDGEEGGTFVYINLGKGMTKAVQISKKNVLVDFQKWLKKFSNTVDTPINYIPYNSDWDKNTTPAWPKGYCPYAQAVPLGSPWVQVVETDQEPFDVSPKIKCDQGNDDLRFRCGRYVVTSVVNGGSTEAKK